MCFLFTHLLHGFYEDVDFGHVALALVFWHIAIHSMYGHHVHIQKSFHSVIDLKLASQKYQKESQAEFVAISLNKGVTIIFKTLGF